MELAYDDGSVEGNITAGSAGVQVAVRFSLPTGWARAKILTARYFISGYPAAFKVRLYGSDGTTELIPSFTVTPTATGWFDVDIEPPVEVDGDFYIVMEWETENQPWIGYDVSYPIDLRSYSGDYLFTGLDFMIRAVVQQVLPPEGVPEFGFSVPIVTSVSAALYLLIKQRLSNRKG